MGTYPERPQDGSWSKRSRPRSGDAAIRLDSRTSGQTVMNSPDARTHGFDRPQGIRCCCQKQMIIILLCLLVWMTPCLGNARSPDYQCIPGVIDLRTTFSDGAYDMEGLAQLAHSKGLDILIINDHDRVAMEYGIPPFRKILKKRVELNSINLQGAGHYLEALREAQKNHPDMVLIPGSETSPFYFWTGNILKGNLTANLYEKRLLTIGLEKPGDYENLPVINNHAALKSYREIVPVAAMLFIAAVIALVMLRWGLFFRISGIVILVLAIALFLNSLVPKDKSPYDPYHGDQGIAPYQLVIDYVISKGGLVFWNYPETKSGTRTMGPITVHTPPYPDALIDSRHYTGLSVLYGDDITITEPGNIWDLTLKEYCRGLRQSPPWGIATADFHRENESGEMLGNYQTVFMVREKSKTAVLDALRNGRVYARQGKFPQLPRLDEFSVTSDKGDIQAVSGEEMTLRGKPTVRVALSLEGSTTATVKVRIIRSGSLVKMFESALPVQITYEDDYFKPGEKIYYRIDMHGAGTVVSNPVFVKFEKPS